MYPAEADRALAEVLVLLTPGERGVVQDALAAARWEGVRAGLKAAATAVVSATVDHPSTTPIGTVQARSINRALASAAAAVRALDPEAIAGEGKTLEGS